MPKPLSLRLFRCAACCALLAACGGGGDAGSDGRNDLVVLGDRNQVFVIAQWRGAPGTVPASRFLP